MRPFVFRYATRQPQVDSPFDLGFFDPARECIVDAVTGGPLTGRPDLVALLTGSTFTRAEADATSDEQTDR